MQHIIDKINDLVWGIPLLILLFVVGIYLTIMTRGIQFRYLIYSHKLAFSRHDDGAQGDISHFQALMTALAATIGIGSITGVATGIAIGGVGSLFWMWIAAIFGMATKYAEAILAIKYRIVDKNGEMSGGPMHYLEQGLKSKFLAILFAIFTIFASFGMGNMVQANSVSLAVKGLFNIDPIWTAIVLTIITGISILKGIKNIGKINGILVPAMAIFYIVGGLIIIFFKINMVPQAFITIFKSALNFKSAAGGVAGASIMTAIQVGVSRGVFSSEAGLGSSPIAAAAAKTDTPGRQSLISMCSVFITTGIVCTITGLVIVLSGVLNTTATLDGSILALIAFNKILPHSGLIATIALIPFAYSTILGWAYYGEKCIEYLFGTKIILPYRIVFTIVVFFGSIFTMQFVWGFSNIMNGLMAFPNLIALFFLAGIVSKETKTFDYIVKKERAIKRNTEC